MQCLDDGPIFNSTYVVVVMRGTGGEPVDRIERKKTAPRSVLDFAQSSLRADYRYILSNNLNESWETSMSGVFS